jgi:hypothetical protein
MKLTTYCSLQSSAINLPRLGASSVNLAHYSLLNDQTRWPRPPRVEFFEYLSVWLRTVASFTMWFFFFSQDPVSLLREKKPLWVRVLQTDCSSAMQIDNGFGLSAGPARSFCLLWNVGNRFHLHGSKLYIATRQEACTTNGY